MNAKVSIVIPVYNRAKKIVEAVQSVQAQTVPDWELILVDDGSKDETPQVLKDLAKKDDRIRVISQENRGAQAARNAGIRAAKAEWVAFLDSDDTWLPKSLELRLAAARSGAPVVHSEAELIDAQGHRKRYNIPPVSGRVYQEVLRSEGPMFQALLVRRAALEEIGLLDESIVAFQEWDTVIRLARRFRFAFVPEPTFVYDCRGTDTISKQMRRGGQGYEQILRKHGMEMFLRTGAYTLIRHYEGAASWYERGEDPESRLRCLERARSWRKFHPGSYFDKIGRLFRK